jgi:hypothetical protein
MGFRKLHRKSKAGHRSSDPNLSERNCQADFPEPVRCVRLSFFPYASLQDGRKRTRLRSTRQQYRFPSTTLITVGCVQSQLIRKLRKVSPNYLVLLVYSHCDLPPFSGENYTPLAGMNSSPHLGHRILSKSMAQRSSGGIEYPHLVQIVLSEASTFSRLILCFLGTRELSHAPSSSALLVGVGRSAVLRVVFRRQENPQLSQFFTTCPPQPSTILISARFSNGLKREK